MPRPAAAKLAVSSRSRETLCALKALVQWAEDQGGYEGGDPSHGHRTPGRWDINGRLCQSCALWNRARQIALSPRKGAARKAS